MFAGLYMCYLCLAQSRYVFMQLRVVTLIYVDVQVMNGDVVAVKPIYVVVVAVINHGN